LRPHQAKYLVQTSAGIALTSTHLTKSASSFNSFWEIIVMGMLELNDLLPSSQWGSNWTFYGADHEGLPNPAEYVVFEYYCDNPACDCQNLYADIMQLGKEGEPIKKSLAVIEYSGSSKEAQCAPVLAEGSPKTVTASHRLEIYKKFIHHPDYLARMKNQYARVKQLTAARDLKKTGMQKNASSKQKQIGRNEPCPCGSNKKYKKCCLGTELSQDM